MEVRAEQLWKAYSPIDSKLSGSWMEVRALQSLNAFVPMAVTLLGNVMDDRFVRD